MGLFYKPLFVPKQVDNAAPDVLYTAPALVYTKITKLVFTNTSAGAVTVTLWLGTGSANAQAMRLAKTLAPAGTPGDTWEAFEAEGYILQPGNAITAQASAATSVTAHGAGIELTQ